MTGCQQDDLNFEPTHANKSAGPSISDIEYFRGAQARKKVDRLYEILDRTGTSRIGRDSAIFDWGYLDDNRVMQVVLKNDKTGVRTTNTTYKIERYHANPNSFINLVLSERRDTTRVTLYGYVMSPRFADQYHNQGYALTNFEGAVYSQHFDVIDDVKNCPNELEVVENWKEKNKNPGGGNGSGPYLGDWGNWSPSHPGDNPFIDDLDDIIYHMDQPGGYHSGGGGNGGGSSNGGGNQGIGVGRVFAAVGSFFADLAGDIGGEISDIFHDIKRWIRSFKSCSCPGSRPASGTNDSYTMGGDDGFVLIDGGFYTPQDPQRLENPYPDGTYFTGDPCHNLAVGILGDGLFSMEFITDYFQDKVSEDITVEDVEWMKAHSKFFVPAITFLEDTRFSEEARDYFYEVYTNARAGKYTYTTNYQAVFLNFWLGLDEDSNEFEWLTTQAPVDQVQQMYDFISDSDRTSPDVDILRSLIDFLRDGNQPSVDVENYLSLITNIKADPNYLLKHYSLDPGDDDYEDWKDLAEYTTHLPQAVINKIETLNSSGNPDYNWSIQDIKDATGANVNMDLFPVKMAQLPNKPAAYYPNANGEQFTPEEFLRFVRTHLNIFTKDENGNPLSTFTPINTDEQILWNSNNPLTAVIHIDIPLNDGSVICSKYNDTEWYFTTLTAPFPVEEDGTHPVSGNRAFGIKTNNDGSYSIYTRGVDRMRYRSLEFLAELNPFMDSPFDPADNLWNAFQERLVDFINDNSFPGNASKIKIIPERVNIEEVHDFIFGAN